MKHTLILLFLITLFSCSQKSLPTDKNATKETIKLYQNLLELQKEKIMYGHQDDLAYGLDWWNHDKRSDTKTVCGDYPAVYGWEIGHLELGDERSLDSVKFENVKNWAIDVYNRGGINTISWHLRNPYTEGSSWDVSSKEVVASIIPGGEKHELYKTWLDILAAYFLDFKNDDGTLIPILFRPFHEHTGSWFWWGKDLCTPEDYKALWRFTVDYLQNEKNVHNVLYSYSTDGVNSKEEYMERYPGDDLVDIIAFDKYDRDPRFKHTLKFCAELVSTLAKEKGKIAAVSETGGPLDKNHTWWMEVFEILEPYDLSYVLTWRNPYAPTDHGAYGPTPNCPANKSFIEFYEHPKTVFQEEISAKNIYR